jgi:hypothetical protein
VASPAPERGPTADPPKIANGSVTALERPAHSIAFKDARRHFAALR